MTEYPFCSVCDPQHIGKSNYHAYACLRHLSEVIHWQRDSFSACLNDEPGNRLWIVVDPTSLPKITCPECYVLLTKYIARCTRD